MVYFNTPSSYAGSTRLHIDDGDIGWRNGLQTLWQLAFGGFSDATQNPKNQVLAVGFDQEGGLLFSLCQQIADADLNPRMDMQFRLLTSDDALLAPYRCDHQREELKIPTPTSEKATSMLLR